MKKRLVLAACFLAFVPVSYSQMLLVAGTNTQNFNSLANGLPANWTVYTSATATSLGTATTFTNAATSWGDSAGAFKNVAAATGLTSTASVTAQSNSTDRALGLRQTSSFGDPGASADFYFSSTGNSITSITLDLMMLSVQARSNTFSIQYGIGTTPTSFVTLGTYPDPGTFGTTSFSFTSANFGTNLDNLANAHFRVVALTASTGTGTQDTIGIDNVVFTTAAVPEPSTYTTLLGAAGLIVLALRCRKSHV